MIFKKESKYTFLFLKFFNKFFKILLKILIFIINIPFKLLFVLSNYIYQIYLFIINNFSDSFFFIKRCLFYIWFFFFKNGNYFFKKFRQIFVFFLFLYFFTGVTPLEILGPIIFSLKDSLLLIISYMCFDSYFFFKIFYNLYIFLNLNFYIKIKVILIPIKFLYIYYLDIMYHINIFIYLEIILTYIYRLIILPVTLFVTYTSYVEFITSWKIIGSHKLEVLDYLIKQEFAREITWRFENYWKTVFGGFLWHPFYRFYKNENGERMILFKYLWFDVFKLRYKTNISLFFYRLPCFILVFPYWVFRYGAFYVLWQYYEYGTHSWFLDWSLNYAIFFYYLRWHILSYFIVSFSIFTLYPLYMLKYLYTIFVNFDVFFNFCVYFYSFFSILKLGLITYIDIYVNVVNSGLAIHSFYFKVYLTVCTDILLKFIFFFYFSAIGTFKICLHFFQCFVPFVRYMYNYNCFIFLIFFDIYVYTVCILSIIFNLSIFIIDSLWRFSVIFLGILCSYPILGLIIGYFAEFFHKIILFPYYIVNINGYFDYFGNHGLFFGRGVTSVFNVFEFVDIYDYVHWKRDYMSVNRRWSLSVIDRYNGLSNAFAFRFINYREIGSGTVFFYIYIWICYIILLFIFCISFSCVNKFLRNKDNIKPDSMYLWYNLTNRNRIDRLSRNELLWLTNSRWLFSLYGIKDLFEKDFYKQFKNKQGSLSKLMFKTTRSSLDNGYYAVLNHDHHGDYKRFINYLITYGSTRYHKRFKTNRKFDDDAFYIRYVLILKKIEKLFEAKIFSKTFAKELFKSINFKISRKVTVENFEGIIKNTRFWQYWLKFAIPITLHGKYSYGTLGYLKNRLRLKSYFKLLKLLLMKKSDKFKDLHDFYFVEHEFYDEFNEDWSWGKKKHGTVLRSIIDSRYANRMVYSSRYLTNKKLFNKKYVKYLYNYIGKIIDLSDWDSKYFGNFINFRMHNILNTDRIVETQLTAEQIEKQVLEEYTDFMEAGWEQDRVDDGAFGIYKYLSDRLFDSFLSNDYSSNPENIWVPMDLTNKLTLRNYYAPLPDPWLALTIILPITVGFYYYCVCVTYSHATIIRSPLYVYELTFFFGYLFFYLQTNTFFITYSLNFLYLPRMFTKKRKNRTFSPSRLISIIEKFLPQDELLKLFVTFYSVTPIILFIFPTYDFLIFYLGFVSVTVIFYKIMINADI